MTNQGQLRSELLLVTVLGAVGIFVLPWHWPVHQEPNTSVSYIYGFNNLVAWLAVALLLGLVLIVRWRDRRRRGQSHDEAALRGLLVRENAEIPRKVSGLAVSVAIVFAVGSVVIWYRLLPVSWFAEMGYFVPRLQMMARGMRPHEDFQFMYGPGMLYPAYWLSAGTGLSLEAAYCAVLAGAWVGGIYLLAYIINSLGIRGSKTRVFWCALLPILLLDEWALGIQYTPLRFVCAPASLFLLNRIHRGAMTRDTFTRRVAPLTVLLAFLLPLANFAWSPEMGMVAWAAFIIYFMVQRRDQPARALSGALAAMASLPAAWILFGGTYVRGLLASGNGAINFPIYPTAHVVMLLVAAGWLMPLLAVIAWSGLRQPGKETPLAASLVVMLGLLIPVALGRCDGGHVYYNGLGIFVLLLAMAMTVLGGWRQRVIFTMVLVVFGLGGSFSLWREYRHEVIDSLRHQMGRPPLAAGQDGLSNLQKLEFDLGFSGKVLSSLFLLDLDHRQSVPPPPFDLGSAGSPAAVLARGKELAYGSDLRELLAYRQIGTPLGSTEEIDRFLKITGRQSGEYYAEPLMSASSLPRKLHDLAAMDVIMVPGYYMVAPGRPPSPEEERRNMSHFLSSLLLFPVKLPEAKHPPFVPSQMIVAKITSDYVEVGRFRDFIIYRRKS